MEPLHHFYHVYADGDWGEAVRDHFDALQRFGLHDALDALMIGFVGCPDNIERVKVQLQVLGVNYTTAVEVAAGWEQVTLQKLHEFTRENKGLVSYAHTKGASHPEPITRVWRRSMEYFNFVRWENMVSHLEHGAKIAGCHWLPAARAENPVWGSSGFFGGTYWWSHCSVLAESPLIDHATRHSAEHWIGQISEVQDLSPQFIYDANPQNIAPDTLIWDW